MKEATIKCDGYSFYMIKRMDATEEDFTKHAKELQEIADKGLTPKVNQDIGSIVWVKQDTV